VRTFDWDVFEQFLTDEIVRCVDDAGARNPDSLPRAAALFDLHARDMLVLFPAVAVTHDRAENSEPWAVHPGDWSWQAETSRDGDRWAAVLTAFAGSGGQVWEQVTDRYFDTLVRACRRATVALTLEGGVAADFSVAAIGDDDGDLHSRCLTPVQLSHRLPRISARRRALARLATLPPTSRTGELVGLLEDWRSQDPGLLAAAGAMLGELGRPGSAAIAALLARRPVDAESWPVWADVADQIPVVAAPLVDVLFETLGDRGVPHRVRARAASSLAWLGYLGEIAPALASLPSEVALDVIARRYLSESKRGRLDYSPLEKVFDRRPELHDALLARLSATEMHDTDAADIATALAAIDSPWPFIRQHASVVMLTAHV